MTVKELALRTVESMQYLGITPQTAWSMYTSVLVPIIELHESLEKTAFNREIVTNHVRQAEDRFERGEISVGFYRKLKCAAQRLTEMYDNNRLILSV